MYNLMMDMLFQYLSGSAMDKFAPSQSSYIKQKGEECSVILDELNNIQYYKPQGRCKFSGILIRFTLMLRYSSTAHKDRSTVNCRQSSAFDRPYLSCNDH